MTPARVFRLLAGLALVVGCGSGQPGFEVVLADLDEPRGLLLGPDLVLCVVEAGTADDSAESTSRYRNETGAVTCADTDLGSRRVLDQLPYSNNRFSGVSVGATDLTIMSGVLYVLVGEGPDDLSRTILGVDGSADGPRIVADFLAYSLATTAPDFFDEIIVMSNPFAMLADTPNRRFLVTDGATGEVLSVGLDGTIEVYSAVEGHEVLTGLVSGPGGSVFVASFSEFPHTRGSGAIVRIAGDGTSVVVLDDLTTPIDLGFDSFGRLYVLEFVDAADPVNPYDGDSGRLLRFERTNDHWGGFQILADGLPHPTAMLIDPDDGIYVSVGGAFSASHSGAVLHFDGLADAGLDFDPVSYHSTLGD